MSLVSVTHEDLGSSGKVLVRRPCLNLLGLTSQALYGRSGPGSAFPLNASQELPWYERRSQSPTWWARAVDFFVTLIRRSSRTCGPEGHGIWLPRPASRPIHPIHLSETRGVQSAMHRTILVFSDVDGTPQRETYLPLLRLSDRIKLKFQIRRRRGGRTEVLDVLGEFRITGIELDLTRGRLRQVLQVASIGVAPMWKSVKNPKTPKLGPARHPRTPIS